MRRNICLLFGAGLVAAVCGIVSCAGGGGGGPVIAQFNIAGRTFAVTLDILNPFEIRANSEPVRQAGTAELFTETPTDTPSSGAMTLDATRVQLRPLEVAKGQVAAQSITGSATVQVYVDSAHSTTPCDTGIEVGTFDLTFADGVITVDNPSITLSPAALAKVMSGSFTICLAVTATVDIILTIEELGVEFAPAAEAPVENENAAEEENQNAAGPENENAAGDENENVADEENENVSDEENENVAGDENENAAGDENENVSDDENENGAEEDVGPYPATIEYYETMAVIVTADDFGDWPADVYRSFGGPAVSADGSRLAFGAYGGWNNQEDTRFYVVDTDGSNLTNVTGTFPDEGANGYYFGNLQLTDSGDRLFGKVALSEYTTVIYYYELPSGNWARAVDQGLGYIGGWKPFMINGEGSRLFFAHVGEYDPVADFTPRGLYYADLGGSPVQFMELADLPDPGAVTWMNVFNRLGCSADGSVVTFTWDEGYDSADDTLAMWKAGVGSAPVKIPNENHTHIFSSQDLPHKLVSADGALALYGWSNSGESKRFELVNLNTGDRTPLADDIGIEFHGDNCISGDGTVARFGSPSGYMARIDLDTLATRDTQSHHTSNNTWPTNVTDLTYDGRYYYYTINSEVSGPQDTIYRVDMEPGAGPYGQAPSIDAIAFSATSLPHDAETTATVTARVSDPQGADQIAGVWITSLAEGVEGASWWTGGAPLTMSAGAMSDDGTSLGDQAAGDGVYTNDMRTSADTNVYEHYGLPYDVGVRIVVKDVDDNYTIADTVLTVTE